MNTMEQVRGCLLGGAVGEALGTPVDAMAWPAIQLAYGPLGISDLVLPSDNAQRSENTQMLLFTADGLLRAFVRNSTQGTCHVPSMIHESLLRWRQAQGYAMQVEVAANGWLVEQRSLWVQRDADRDFPRALALSSRLGAPADNFSKGCSGLMRAAPCAFFGNAFAYAADSAHLTHGHPSGYLAAGLFADILQRLVGNENSLEHAITQSLATHGTRPGMTEVKAMVERALVYFYENYRPTPERIAGLGSGHNAEEALAIGLWCALMADDFEVGVLNAVNHSGNSSGTGQVAGHVLGLQRGVRCISSRWLARLEMRDVLEHMAMDLHRVPREFCGVGLDMNKAIERDYPTGFVGAILEKGKPRHIKIGGL
ncbi:ADP-ribosylglycohydrolase family protein [Pseudomonas japonica]|uniref:ADP-ribosylglycohydrolase family protein n=1 Tax=Pseudomonas japonica TaxID=256466 RepID=UPI0015E3AEFA|nr:ADP-ribosylglycohydrolase family protein [Pseudomonas japonica]MBA1290986.1 ADP-ribosylglycohydrolase family protein [Pseudomonas japonica]